MKNQTKYAFVIDTHGNRWLWNCGWYIVDKNGEPTRTRSKKAKNFGQDVEQWPDVDSRSRQRPDSRQQPMTHVEFRRNVKVLNPHIKKEREVLHGMDRPGRYWRRFVARDSWEHTEFGSIYLLASDGCHAIIETQDGQHHKVCFENLSEPKGVPLPPRQGKKTTTKQPSVKSKSAEQMFSRYMALARPTQ